MLDSARKNVSVKSLKTILSSAVQWASEQPNKVAYSYPTFTDQAPQQLSYFDLINGAARVGEWLRKRQAKDARVLQLLPTGPDFVTSFLGCFYAGAVAVPAPAPDNTRLKRTLPRLLRIVEDCDPSIILTTSELLPGIRKYLANEDIGSVDPDIIFSVDDIPEHTSDQFQPEDLEDGQLAYLQYSSGTTSAPKGVCISHRNLIANTRIIQEMLHYDRESICAAWTPHFHDYGLVEGLMTPLYCGATAHIFSPVAFLRRPSRWLKLVSDEKITHCGAPNFGYAMCVDRVKPSELVGVDLSAWRVAHCGAEPIRKETVDNFLTKFADYGQSLAVLATTAYFISAGGLLAQQTNEIDDGDVHLC